MGGVIWRVACVAVGMVRRHLHGRAGTSLLEAVIAAGVLATVLTGVLPLVTTATVMAVASRTDLLAAHLARQRLSHLEALTYTRTADGIAIDVDSRLPPTGYTSGGTGLVATGAATLVSSSPGWSDWLDERGAWLVDGATVPAGARYRRRWAVAAGAADGCLHLWVEVLPVPAMTVLTRPARVAALQCPWGMAAS
jgi:Tfp pilus assembly protein PilV